MIKSESVHDESAFSLMRCAVITLSVLAALTITGCKPGNKVSSRLDAARRAEGGVEKVKPAPGTGNVQGKVFFNSKPVENIEVKLCETFSRYLSGCGGKTYTARTDKDGEYVITNLPPKTYEALTARVFDTDSYIFATTGLAGISAEKYEVVDGQTFFVTPIHLFKGDLKTINPKAGSKVPAEGLELKWETYPDAAYYKFSTYAEDSSVTSPYVNDRVQGTTFSVTTPMAKGTYRFQVAAYNKDDRKLAESSSDVKFTVQ